MARMNHKGQLRGSVGPVSYHTYNDRIYLQSKPGRGHVKQTAATLKTASDFGRASSMGKAIRRAVYPILQDRADHSFYRRFCAAIHAATQMDNAEPKGSRLLIDGNLALLAETDCNVTSRFKTFCALASTLTLSDTLQLSISLPEFNIRENISAPASATDAALHFLVTALDPVTGQQTEQELFQLAFSLQNLEIAATSFETAALPPGRLIVVATAVFYFRKNHVAGLIPLNSKELHPCEITAVLKS